MAPGFTIGDCTAQLLPGSRYAAPASVIVDRIYRSPADATSADIRPHRVASGRDTGRRTDKRLAAGSRHRVPRFRRGQRSGTSVSLEWPPADRGFTIGRDRLPRQRHECCARALCNIRLERPIGGNQCVPEGGDSGATTTSSTGTQYYDRPPKRAIGAAEQKPRAAIAHFEIASGL
jgi:hypothetical protein